MQTFITSFLGINHAQKRSPRDSDDGEEWKPDTQQLPDEWTRVISRSLMEKRDIKLYNIDKDKSDDKKMASLRKHLNDVKSQLIFDP